MQRAAGIVIREPVSLGGSVGSMLLHKDTISAADKAKDKVGGICIIPDTQRMDATANISVEGEVCSSSLPFPCTRFDDKPTSHSVAPPRCGQRMLYVPDIRVVRPARRQPRGISGPVSRTNLPNGLADEHVRPAPFRMRGALSYYRSFGVCNQICSHCDALFWLEERLIGRSTKARPVYHRYCLGRKVLGIRWYKVAYMCK